MDKIDNIIRKEAWFKVGKWKEPVFLQDIIVRSYLEKPQKNVALPYYPTSYFIVDFK